MIKIIKNRSGAGVIWEVYSIDNYPTPGTWGSHQLLLEEYKRLDEEWQMGIDGELNGRFKQVIFNTNFLDYILKKYGELHCEYCNEQNLKIVHWGEKPLNNQKKLATADHFIPKHSNLHLAFNTQNLVVSCVRCNCKLKGGKEWPVSALKYYYPERKIWKYQYESMWK